MEVYKIIDGSKVFIFCWHNKTLAVEIVLIGHNSDRCKIFNSTKNVDDEERIKMLRRMYKEDGEKL
jgi:hypothetical protein